MQNKKRYIKQYNKNCTIAQFKNLKALKYFCKSKNYKHSLGEIKVDFIIYKKYIHKYLQKLKILVTVNDGNVSLKEDISKKINKKIKSALDLNLTLYVDDYELRGHVFFAKNMRKIILFMSLQSVGCNRETTNVRVFQLRRCTV